MKGFKKRYLIPLALIFPCIKFLGYSNVDFSTVDFYKSNIKQSLKPPVSGTFGLDLNINDNSWKWFYVKKLIKKLEADNTVKKYVKPTGINNRTDFINKLCVGEVNVYGLQNLIWYDTKPSSNGYYTKQLIEDLLFKNQHLERTEANLLWGIVNKWDSVLSVDVFSLSRVIDKLKTLKNTKTIKDKKSITSAVGKPYNEYDAVNITLEIAMAVLFELGRLISA